MAGIERGAFENPRKSAWNFEVYDSGRRGYRNERLMMERLEADPAVRKWTKRHGISIPWIDARHQRHAYHPDFLVEYVDGSLAIIEVKGGDRVDSDAVRRKQQAADLWCKRRGMTYKIVVA